VREAEVAAAYDRSEASHWWFRARRAVLSTFLAIIPRRDEKIVLEIGCGSGGNLQLLFRDFRQRVGLDRSAHAIAYARRKAHPGDWIVCGDANRLAFPPAAFDCVALLDVLCHRAIRDPHDLLLQVREVLKPGGYVLVTDAAYAFLRGAHSCNVEATRRFTRQQLIALLHAAGFRVVRASYWGMVVFALLVLKRMVLERISSALGRRPGPQTFDVVEVPVVDSVLYAAVGVEALLLRYVSLPFGASVCVLGRK
jgi:SAM-dependent methyltransferase